MQIKLIDFGASKLPQRAHFNDAGADVRATIDLLVLPGETYKVPLGFGIDLPDGLMGIVHPRSSVASKGIVLHNAPVDSGYKGEIHAILTNVSNFPFVIATGDRIAQLVISPVILADFKLKLGEERGEGSFGSTGK